MAANEQADRLLGLTSTVTVTLEQEDTTVAHLLYRMSQDTIEVEAVLFDLDGTLIDSTQGVFNAWEGFGKIHPFVDGLGWMEVAHKTHGRRLVETLKQYCNIPDNKLPAAITEFEDIVINYGGGPQVLPGARELLEEFKQIAPDRWTIVTSASGGYASAAIAKRDLPIPSKGLITADDIGPGQGKPNPAPYLAGAGRISDQADFATKCPWSGNRRCPIRSRCRAASRRQNPGFENLERVSVQVLPSGSLRLTIDKADHPTTAQTTDST
ncbi:hypothetical protein ID866_382 [Astraeus odoratus]|nr:hypothetical protein ID866_382 [Astraeus odoratus]